MKINDNILKSLKETIDRTRKIVLEDKSGNKFEIMKTINETILSAVHSAINESVDESSFKKLLDEVVKEMEKDKYDPEIYVDYNDIDAIEDNHKLIQDMLDSINPRGEFDEYIFDAYRETEDEVNWDTLHKIYETMKSRDNSLPDWSDLDDDLQEMVETSVYEKLPAYVNIDRLLKDAHFKLDVIFKDTIGNFNSFTFDDADGKLVNINDGLAKILELFGYSAESFISYVNENKKSDKFLDNLMDELKGSDDDNKFVFVAEVSLADIISIKESGVVQIKEGCNGGLFDSSVGAGSYLDVEAPKTVDVKLSDVELYDDKELHYGIDETYGLVGSFWKRDFIK